MSRACATVLVLGICAGCTYYVEPKDVSDKIREVLIQMDRYVVLTEPFFRKTAARKLESQAQKTAFAQMRRSVAAIRSHKAEALRIQGTIDRWAREKDTITSDDPRWPKVQALQEAYEKLGERANASLDQLRKATGDFIQSGGAGW